MGRLKKRQCWRNGRKSAYLGLRLKALGKCFRSAAISAQDFYGYGKDGGRRLGLDLRCGRTCFLAIKPAFTL